MPSAPEDMCMTMQHRYFLPAHHGQVSQQSHINHFNMNSLSGLGDSTLGSSLAVSERWKYFGRYNAGNPAISHTPSSHPNSPAMSQGQRKQFLTSQSLANYTLNSSMYHPAPYYGDLRAGSRLPQQLLQSPTQFSHQRFSKQRQVCEVPSASPAQKKRMSQCQPPRSVPQSWCTSTYNGALGYGSDLFPHGFHNLLPAQHLSYNERAAQLYSKRMSAETFIGARQQSADSMQFSVSVEQDHGQAQSLALPGGQCQCNEHDFFSVKYQHGSMERPGHPCHQTFNEFSNSQKISSCSAFENHFYSKVALKAKKAKSMCSPRLPKKQQRKSRWDLRSRISQDQDRQSEHYFQACQTVYPVKHSSLVSGAQNTGVSSTSTDSWSPFGSSLYNRSANELSQTSDMHKLAEGSQEGRTNVSGNFHCGADGSQWAQIGRGASGEKDHPAVNTEDRTMLQTASPLLQELLDENKCRLHEGLHPAVKSSPILQTLMDKESSRSHNYLHPKIKHLLGILNKSKDFWASENTDLSSHTQPSSMNNSTDERLVPTGTELLQKSCQCARYPIICHLHNPLGSQIQREEDTLSASDPRLTPIQQKESENAPDNRSDDDDELVLDLLETDVDIMKRTYESSGAHELDSQQINPHGELPQAVSGLDHVNQHTALKHSESDIQLIDHTSVVLPCDKYQQDTVKTSAEIGRESSPASLGKKSLDMYHTCLACKRTFRSTSQLEEHLFVHLESNTNGGVSVDREHDGLFQDDAMDSEHHPAHLRPEPTEQATSFRSGNKRVAVTNETPENGGVVKFDDLTNETPGNDGVVKFDDLTNETPGNGGVVKFDDLTNETPENGGVVKFDDLTNETPENCGVKFDDLTNETPGNDGVVMFDDLTNETPGNGVVVKFDETPGNGVVVKFDDVTGEFVCRLYDPESEENSQELNVQNEGKQAFQIAVGCQDDPVSAKQMLLSPVSGSEETANQPRPTFDSRKSLMEKTKGKNDCFVISDHAVDIEKPVFPSSLQNLQESKTSELSYSKVSALEMTRTSKTKTGLKKGKLKSSDNSQLKLSGLTTVPQKSCQSSYTKQIGKSAHCPDKTLTSKTSGFDTLKTGADGALRVKPARKEKRVAEKHRAGQCSFPVQCAVEEIRSGDRESSSSPAESQELRLETTEPACSDVLPVGTKKKPRLKKHNPEIISNQNGHSMKKLNRPYKPISVIHKNHNTVASSISGEKQKFSSSKHHQLGTKDNCEVRCLEVFKDGPAAFPIKHTTQINGIQGSARTNHTYSLKKRKIDHCTYESKAQHGQEALDMDSIPSKKSKVVGEDKCVCVVDDLEEKKCNKKRMKCSDPSNSCRKKNSCSHSPNLCGSKVQTRFRTSSKSDDPRMDHSDLLDSSRLVATSSKAKKIVDSLKGLFKNNLHLQSHCLRRSKSGAKDVKCVEDSIQESRHSTSKEIIETQHVMNEWRNETHWLKENAEGSVSDITHSWKENTDYPEKENTDNAESTTSVCEIVIDFGHKGTKGSVNASPEPIADSVQVCGDHRVKDSVSSVSGDKNSGQGVNVNSLSNLSGDKSSAQGVTNSVTHVSSLSGGKSSSQGVKDNSVSSLSGDRSSNQDMDNSVNRVRGEKSSNECVNDNKDFIFCIKCMTMFTKRLVYDEHGCCQKNQNAEESNEEEVDEVASEQEDAAKTDPSICIELDIDNALSDVVCVSDASDNGLSNVVCVDDAECNQEQKSTRFKSKSLSKVRKEKKRKRITSSQKKKKPMLLRSKTDKTSASGHAMFKCEHCDQNYSSRGGLLFHWQAVHRKSVSRHGSDEFVS